MSTEASVENLTFEADWLCLDFANTVEWHASHHPTEYLNSYGDLIRWAQRGGLIDEAEFHRLLQAAEQQPEAADDTLKQAIALREAIYRILSAVAGERQPKADDLTRLNSLLPAALGHLQLAESSNGFSWEYSGTNVPLNWVLWPVVRSAAELLTSDQLDRVKECEDDRGCGYLFLDTSKNRSRRWCSMESCGNRAKVRRHRKRKKVDAD